MGMMKALAFLELSTIHQSCLSLRSQYNRDERLIQGVGSFKALGVYETKTRRTSGIAYGRIIDGKVPGLTVGN